eukprot:7508873-Pyramimonas_sp.AAC.1
MKTVKLSSSSSCAISVSMLSEHAQSDEYLPDPEPHMLSKGWAASQSAAKPLRILPQIPPALWA